MGFHSGLVIRRKPRPRLSSSSSSVGYVRDLACPHYTLRGLAPGDIGPTALASSRFKPVVKTHIAMARTLHTMPTHKTKNESKTRPQRKLSEPGNKLLDSSYYVEPI